MKSLLDNVVRNMGFGLILGAIAGVFVLAIGAIVALVVVGAVNGLPLFIPLWFAILGAMTAAVLTVTENSFP